MDSALCLHRGALHIPSTTSRAAGLARPYSSFEPSSLSLFSKASTYPILSRHTFCSPVICALNKPSPPSPNYDKDNGKRIVMVVGGASVVLACVLGVINYNFNFIPTAIAAPQRNRSLSPTPEESAVGPVLTRPKDVLDSLLKVNRHLATSISESKWRLFKSTPQQLSMPATPSPQDCENLKIAVADFIKSGMCDEAERKLIDLYKETEKKGSIPANEVELELVLVLIFQGKYEKALERGCLSDDAMVGSDGRVHFYKAIIYTMLDRDEEAKSHWDMFVSSFDSQPPNMEKLEVARQKQKRILR